MNTNIKIHVALLSLFTLIYLDGKAQDATAIVKRADDKMRGEKSGYSVMSMQIIRPTWTRTVGFKSWSKGSELSMVYITDPVKEKGQSFLKFKLDMWNWNPQINRMIKLPTSMLSQGWMGSDYTNDDLLNERSIVVDYSHKLLGEETVSGEVCYKIELIPLEDAPVVWGKIIIWISKKYEISLKVEYYDEDGYLVKTELGKDIKNMSGRTIPTKFELVPADEEGNKTVITISEIQFNIPIEDSFFTQQNMKKVR